MSLPQRRTQQEPCSSRARRQPDRGDRAAGPGAEEGQAVPLSERVSAARFVQGVPACARRRTYALMVYLYLRPGELDALTLHEDVDLEHGVVHVHRATCGRTGQEKVVKTGDTRRVAIEAELMPLLEAIHAEADGEWGKVAPLLGLDDNLARQLRNDLKLAGVTRKELFVEGDPTRKAMTFYDLRATGITWMALRRDIR